MTQEGKISEENLKNAAKEFAEREYEYNSIDRNALEKGFYWGAKWQKEQIIDKACEWLEDNVFSSEQLDRNYSRMFREAMK